MELALPALLFFHNVSISAFSPLVQASSVLHGCLSHVFMRVRMCVCVLTRTCAYVYVFAYGCVHLGVHAYSVCVHACVWVCMCMCVSACLCVQMCLCEYVYVYVCMCAHTCLCRRVSMCVSLCVHACVCARAAGITGGALASLPACVARWLHIIYLNTFNEMREPKTTPGSCFTAE